MSLKSAIQQLDSAIDDLSSLHVQTFTGSIAFTNEHGQPVQGYQNIENHINHAKSEGKVKLVAESLYKFDGDSYNFLADDQQGISSAALELHKAAVEGGIKTRQGLMQMAKDIVGL